MAKHKDLDSRGIECKYGFRLISLLLKAFLQMTAVTRFAERIKPLRFLAGCHKRRLNQALSVLSLSLPF